MTEKLANDGTINPAMVLLENSAVPYHRYLTVTGDGTGNRNLNGNYAAEAISAYYEAKQRVAMYMFLVTVSDSTNFVQSDYGAINGGLTNGVKFFVKPNGQSEIPLLNNTTIKKNYEWAAVMSNLEMTSFFGTAQTLAAHLHLVESYGCPLVLNAGDRFIVRLNDDFTGLVNHTFVIGVKTL